MLVIVGAGSIGRLWAAHLSMPVVFASTRAEELADIQPIEYAVHRLFKAKHVSQTTRHKIRLVPAKLLDQEPLVPKQVLLCTKSHAAAQAAMALYQSIPKETPLILFQNGLGSQHAILEKLASTPIFAAVSTEGVNFDKTSNTLNYAGRGHTQIGPLNAPANETANTDSAPYQALSKAGLSLTRAENIWQTLWHKLIINCAINPYTAIANCANGEVLETLRFKSDWPILKQELSMLSHIAGYPLSETQVEQKVFDVANATAQNVSSMLQDVRAKRQTEINDINGFAYRMLAKHTKPHRCNQKLWEDIYVLRH